MNDILIYLAIGLVLFFAIRLLSSFDRKILEAVKNDACKRGLTIKLIREAYASDGFSPIKQPTIRIGPSSNIFGMSGEQVIDKIVIVSSSNGDETYWVEVKTSLFSPSELSWKRIEVSES